MANVALLQGKKVLVTGAARGLGRDFAQAIAEAGAQVVMADILDDRVQEVAIELQQRGLKVEAVKIDLADAVSIQQAVEQAVKYLGGLDGLVNCAALATNVGGKSLMDYDADLWDRVMNINVKGTWLVTKACVPFLKQADAGKVINVASDTALWGAPNLMAYVASKGALVAMTRSMARELGQFNICINTLSPGLTLVEATEYVPQERHDLYVNGRAIQRQQLPQDLNGTALYLLSDLSSFVTGQNIPVNGGFVFN
ncbi:short-chain dehydrogenase [Acinetobacter junii]|jgi:NAD(P)-dependent dehydrogenase (short-subunit alcohol dehydrogenase family)|uniref:SDR family oxidoreductase n=1 Tax=Acinetobacter junii TaxID=40215 RepID=A0AAX1MKH1_ACIJU|nr:SDR family oxidoreductase [Acinetobacter junii]AZN68597.1 SDR family oxidoreductase [Acinetobacter haemolyticus]ATU45018.1 short-chain dehydrogenase [Acinetobacter junii]QUY37670.1 SDR family oxidoreductase [Acinetobacter junii]RXS96188.1 SDR family oxidoreductase [Acinetobacter junii]UOB53439.1 SDR family oxidoreductase [Acinetobacter junii]